MTQLAKALKISCCYAVASLAAAAAPAEWPQFRGPNASGVSSDARPPVAIAATNANWAVALPFSPSSPVVAGRRLFLTAYDDEELQTRAYDRGSGRLLWKKGVKPDRLEVFHRTDNTPAASTPATDGRRVVSYFGSAGLVAYDMDGRELWRHPLPVAVSGGSYGTGTSPVLVGDLVVLNRDVDGGSTLLAVNAGTGKTVWETPRPDASGSFGTAVIWNDAGVDEIVTPGSLVIKGYDLKTGVERWFIGGLNGFACTTPVVGDGWLFYGGWSPGGSDSPMPTWDNFAERYDANKDGDVALDELPAAARDYMRGFDVDHDGKITKADFAKMGERLGKAQNQLIAVKPGGRGDIGGSHVAWQFKRGLPYVPSPLFYDGRVYLVKDGGMMTSVDAKTGSPYYTQERLDAVGSYYASPVAANGSIYISSLPGKVTVVKAGGDKPEILSQTDFGERILATPALAGGDLFLRTEHHLYGYHNAAAQR